jgi:hypothetical protein
MKVKEVGSFKEELDDCQQYESPGLRDRMDELFEAAKANNMFLIEIISPGEHHKIIVDTSSGKVLDWVQFELSQAEYEKHLGGMYHGTKEEKRTQAGN